MQDRRLRKDVLFIRAQSTIRADGAPSAQVRAMQFEILCHLSRYRRTAIARSARQPRFLYGAPGDRQGVTGESPER